MSNSKLIPDYETQKNQLVSQLKGMLPAEQFQVFADDANSLGIQFPKPLLIDVGDTSPQFSLPNAVGKTINSKELLAKGPIVLTFFRGGWCPYCNLYLKNLQSALPQIAAAGASLVAISPQKPDQSLSMKEKNELKFHLLSDQENQVTGKFTTLYTYSDLSVKAMSDLGYDYYSFYENKKRELSVPATFIIQQDGVISYAKSMGGDFRMRVDAADVIQSL